MFCENLKFQAIWKVISIPIKQIGELPHHNLENNLRKIIKKKKSSMRCHEGHMMN